MSNKTETEITPDAMRVLLEELIEHTIPRGGWRAVILDSALCRDETMQCMIESHSGGLRPICLEEWFVLACLEYLESDRVKAVLYVNFFNQEGCAGGSPVSTHWVLEKKKNGRVEMFTGPLRQRIVRAACYAAGLVRAHYEKKEGVE